MKEKINILSLKALTVAAVICFTGCSDDFLKDKKVYGSFDGSVVYEYYETAKSRIDYLYRCLLPNATGGSNALSDIVSAGINDDFSKCTEEYGEYSLFNNPSEILTIQSVPDYFYVINGETSPWGRIRECNDVIEGVTGSETLTQTEKEELLGQAYFFRAWRYYLLVKMYGGVPIVDHVQNPVIGDGNGENLVIPRSSTKDCVNFICDDLDLASRYLPVRWPNESDYGRITSGAALALKGRMLLLYASPLFNRADDQSRWKAAYDANSAAITALKAGNFGLAYESNGGDNNAKNWAKMFADYTGGSEAVFVTLYNNVSPIAGQNINKYNLWEQGIRPGNINGGGGRTATSEMVDLFPMADGKRPGESTYTYSKEDSKIFMNRDPRFYRTFAFPGVEWKFNSGDVDFSDDTMNGLCPSYYTSGADYELWNYCWYVSATDLADPSRSGYAADKLGTKNRSVYVRKRSNDDPSSSLNVFTDNSSGDQQGFRRSAAPYMEIRYAEVLLNLAESACGAGGTYHAEGVQALKDVRARVGYTAANNYGLNTDIESDRAKLFAAVLYERQVELAYEGKRAYDMRRWMLFDGGAGQGALNASWALSGFSGNTCNYLGVTPMNARGKRHRIEIHVDGTGAANDNSDPLKNVTRPTALTLSENIVSEMNGDDEIIADPVVQAMCQFYKDNFTRKDISLDGNTLGIDPVFQPRYYFFGLRQSAQQTNATLYQTIGWEDHSHGGMGTFDPLAE
ncbi:RagB/SusD family nutrient uptake outer membrane protein [Bacteroides sp.]|uniref:RagB/SusD family nutrient uptake outer membrane protein n=1 Tax=Bacteroides sp. TaxID=29523 RepID=UPI0025BCDF6E|nr:RagB/SusD family nutrient uptake outer membrane protein [Bacteroides sp.]